MTDTLHVQFGGPISMHIRSVAGGTPLTDEDMDDFADDDKVWLYCENCDIYTSISVLRAWVELGRMESLG